MKNYANNLNGTRIPILECASFIFACKVQLQINNITNAVTVLNRTVTLLNGVQDAKTLGIIKGLYAGEAVWGNTILGSVSAPLVSQYPPLIDHPLLHFVMDSFLLTTNCDLAMISIGGMKSGLPSNITSSNMFVFDPYGDTMVKLLVKGNVIRNLVVQSFDAPSTHYLRRAWGGLILFFIYIFNHK